MKSEGKQKAEGSACSEKKQCESWRPVISLPCTSYGFMAKRSGLPAFVRVARKSGTSFSNFSYRRELVKIPGEKFCLSR